MKVKKLLQDNSIPISVISTPLVPALYAAEVWAVMFTLISLALFLLGNQIFDSRADESNPEETFNKVGKHFLIAGVAVCFLFNGFIVARQDLIAAVTQKAESRIESEIGSFHSKGKASTAHTDQIPHAIIATIDPKEPKAIYAKTRDVLKAIFVSYGDQIFTALWWLCAVAIFFMTAVVLMGWSFKTVLIPLVLKTLESTGNRTGPAAPGSADGISGSPTPL